ncbi:MAG: hypothetical protein SFU27_05110 [Thermonemataceae bacterium]|nr:hypothetical protein [Thermonemataceae bacterium]
MSKLLFLGCFFLSLGLFAQKISKKDSLDLKPLLYFQDDSLLLGKPTQVSLSFRYPKHLQIVFCDTSHNYAPFELENKQFFPTHSDSLFSVDSAVYTLRSFEIDKKQVLRLPIFLIKPEGDSLILYSNTDSIYFQSQISASIPLENLSLQADTSLILLEEKFNFHFFIFWGVTLLFLVAIVWVLFGNWIKQQITLLNLKRKHLFFEDAFDREIARIRTRRRMEDIEQALHLWKKHLEQIEEKPFSTFTSREILEELPIEVLGEKLQNIDKAIYGAIIEEGLENDFLYLKALAHKRYIRKKATIRVGKK